VPELPEVESLRRSLATVLKGCHVVDSRLRRRDILHTAPKAQAVPFPGGASILRLHRRGKQLVIESDHGCLLVHLGMSGSLRWLDERGVSAHPRDRHVHAEWTLQDTKGLRWVLRHRDPRRFGWLEWHRDMRSVECHAWSALGPDALHVTARNLIAALGGTRRPIKAVLLDQGVLAGVGNIYADEALFHAGVHPMRRASSLHADDVARLAKALRKVLRSAVRRGGSTIRDHRGPDGTWGSYQRHHMVYGRSGSPCRLCGRSLLQSRIAQRATVHCPACQPWRPGRS
jgi:formamidopyrimidine-DNA glycosylase